MTMRATAAIFVGALVVAAGVSVSDARACGFIDYRESRPRVHSLPVARGRPIVVPASDRIAAADQRLEEERPANAGAEVVAAFPDIRNASVGASPLETRALRIVSLALVRADGTLAARGFTAATETDRVSNLEWAVSVLRMVDALRKNDPVARADLGEALAKRPKYEAESLAILADLADRDLMGSAHAYAALARLRVARGEAAASDRATRRCELMTKSPSSVCRSDARLAGRD
jgi:hypothetical protein